MDVREEDRLLQALRDELYVAVVSDVLDTLVGARGRADMALGKKKSLKD